MSNYQLDIFKTFEEKNSLDKLEHQSGSIHFIGEALDAPSIINPSALTGSVGDSPLAAREDHIHAESAHSHLIFADNTARDAWAGTKLAGMQCTVLAPGTVFGVAGSTARYIWNGSSWVAWTFPAYGQWPAYTPSLAQSASVSYTASNIRFKVVEGVCFASGICLVTSSGTAGNVIKVGLPVTARTGGGLPCGSGSVYDASANVAYAGMAYLDSTTLMALQGGSGAVNNGLGASGFVAAIANTDSVTWSISYEIA